MKHFILLSFLACGSLGTLSADVIVSTNCSLGPFAGSGVPIQQNTTNSANCSVQNASYPQYRASAGMAVSQLTTIPDAGITTGIISALTGSADARAIYTGMGGGYASANATGTITNQLYTTGPVRSGIIEFQFGSTNWLIAGDYRADFSASIGLLSGSCGGAYPICTGTLFGNAPRLLTAPFTLGNAFSFQLSEILTPAGDGAFTFGGSTSGTVFLRFQLLEADGTTPVAIYAAPEPGTLGLLLIGVVGCGAFLLSRLPIVPALRK